MKGLSLKAVKDIVFQGGHEFKIAFAVVEGVAVDVVDDVGVVTMCYLSVHIDEKFRSW